MPKRVNRKTQLASVVDHQPDRKQAGFPTPTPYQVALSVIDDLSEALEERRKPDRRVSNTASIALAPSGIERRKTQRRKRI